MIQSMTGYGRAVAQLSSKNVIIEIKSLNSKQLDLNSRVAMAYRDKDLQIRNFVSSQLVRGKVDINLSVEMKDGESDRNLQEALVETYYKKIKSLSERLGANDFSILESVLRFPDVWSVDTQSLASEEDWQIVQNALQQATNSIVEYRKQEGKALENDLRTNIKTILSLLSEIEVFEKQRVPAIRERIESALSELIASEKIDKNRLEQEMIFYIEKLDINEEKVRLTQHCKYFIDTIDNEEFAGKKLNFIAQEMGREINTMGSKSSDANMQRIVVQMKDDLEKIKEQVLNVL